MERLPGFRDFYPEPIPAQDVWSMDVRNALFDSWRATARRYNFAQYDGPPLEPLELYTLKSGEEIVGQLYNFVDKGERHIALRPEMTPTLARMASAYNRNYRKPIKWFAVPQLFRYERQQRGRLREHFQFNADILGEASPAADAELIALLIDSLRALGLTSEDFVLRLSSRSVWHDFYIRKASQPERAPEFYQVVDKLERQSREQSEAKLSELGFSVDEVLEFIQASRPNEELQQILANLTSRGLGDYARIDYNVIRGLAYYSGVVFEAFDKKGEFRAIAGGGRYDNLVQLVSGGKVQLPAVGFGMGDVVLVELLKQRNRLPKRQSALDVYFIIEDEGVRGPSLELIQNLRDRGAAVEYGFLAAKADKQFKRALELQATYLLKVERQASGELSVRVRNIQARQEEVVSLEEAVDRVVKV